MTNDSATRATEEAFTAGVITASALLAEHFAFWPWAKHVQLEDELGPLLVYIVGTGTIGIGLSGLALRRPITPIDFWIIAGCSGAAIGGARVWRFLLNSDRAVHQERARAAGHVAGGRIALEAYEKYRAGN